MQLEELIKRIGVAKTSDTLRVYSPSSEEKKEFKKINKEGEKIAKKYGELTDRKDNLFASIRKKIGEAGNLRYNPDKEVVEEYE